MRLYSLWLLLVHGIHKLTFRLLPESLISYGMVGITGVSLQLLATYILMQKIGFAFEEAIPLAVLISASSNYIFNNYLTFKYSKLKGTRFIKGLFKFLIIATLTITLNIFLANYFYSFILRNEILAQLASILLVFLLNYVGSSYFVWRTK